MVADTFLFHYNYAMNDPSSPWLFLSFSRVTFSTLAHTYLTRKIPTLCSILVWSGPSSSPAACRKREQVHIVTALNTLVHPPFDDLSHPDFTWVQCLNWLKNRFACNILNDKYACNAGSSTAIRKYLYANDHWNTNAEMLHNSIRKVVRTL